MSDPYNSKTLEEEIVILMQRVAECRNRLEGMRRLLNDIMEIDNNIFNNLKDGNPKRYQLPEEEDGRSRRSDPKHRGDGEDH